MVSGGQVEGIFARVVAWRVWLLVAFAALVAPAIYLALQIPSLGSIDRLIVSSDADYAATRAFQKTFPESKAVLLLLEAPDPFAPPVLARLQSLEAALREQKGLSVFSPLSVYRRAHPGFSVDARSEELRRFALGAVLLRKQGLVGDGFIGLAVGFPSGDAEERDAMLHKIDTALAHAQVPSSQLHRVGLPYVEAWIEHASREATGRYFLVFAVFVVAVVLFLYRSWRSLAAILLALGATVVLALAAGRLLGFSFTLVSSLVPLTVMVTTLASLVYVHSRFVDQPEGTTREDHQLFALANKLLPVSASCFAAALGFFALSVSNIRPIREMGIWTAIGLLFAWLTTFTLFPALQAVLRTPTGRTVSIRSAFYDRLSLRLPRFTFRWRWLLLSASLGLSLAGLVALFGLPGRLAPLRIGVDALDYVDPSLPLYRDMVFFREHVAGVDVARLWLRTSGDVTITDADVLRGIEKLTRRIEALHEVSSVVGPTTFLRMRRYLAGEGETLPDDASFYVRAAGEMEQLLLTEPELRGFVDLASLNQAQLITTFRGGDYAAIEALRTAVQKSWRDIQREVPALADASLQLVGEGVLQAKVGKNLVPTLSESFAVTAALIFLAFLFVFRSASARLLAMIPSLFAILTTFLGMRLFGGELNVATILIATTVLGTTENDQIHFFHHLQEGAGDGGLEGALRHSLRVAGRAIVFATFINAAGFLALGLSSFPPLRQFGVVTACAFGLAMLADLSALPAALWLLSRQRPHGVLSASGERQLPVSQ